MRESGHPGFEWFLCGFDIIESKAFRQTTGDTSTTVPAGEAQGQSSGLTLHTHTLIHLAILLYERSYHEATPQLRSGAFMDLVW